MIRIFNAAYAKRDDVHYLKIGRLNLAFSFSPARRDPNAPRVNVRINTPAIRLSLPEIRA